MCDECGMGYSMKPGEIRRLKQSFGDVVQIYRKLIYQLSLKVLYMSRNAPIESLQTTQTSVYIVQETGDAVVQ